ncbi:hypothetical protein ACQP2K_39655 [Microbispora siamensis]
MQKRKGFPSSMRTNTPAPFDDRPEGNRRAKQFNGHTCRIPWCRTSRFNSGGHGIPETAHMGDGGTFDSGGPIVSIMLLQEETVGRPSEPAVLLFHDDQDEWCHIEITPTDAQILAAIIRALSREQITAFATALADTALTVSTCQGTTY